jgi:hypothetical protein
LCLPGKGFRADLNAIVVGEVLGYALLAFVAEERDRILQSE